MRKTKSTTNQTSSSLNVKNVGDEEKSGVQMNEKKEKSPAPKAKAEVKTTAAPNSISSSSSHQKNNQPKSNHPQPVQVQAPIKSSVKDREELKQMQFNELNQYARRLGIVGAGLMKKDDLIKRIIHLQENPDEE